MFSFLRNIARFFDPLERIKKAGKKDRESTQELLDMLESGEFAQARASTARAIASGIKERRASGLSGTDIAKKLGKLLEGTTEGISGGSGVKTMEFPVTEGGLKYLRKTHAKRVPEIGTAEAQKTKRFMAETAVGIGTTPFRIGKSLGDVSTIYRSGGQEVPKETPIPGGISRFLTSILPSGTEAPTSIKSYFNILKENEKELEKQGISPNIATTAAALMASGESILEINFLGKMVETGAQYVTQKIKAPNESVVSAWETLGRPKTIEEAKTNQLQLSHILHPDKGGSNEVQALINDSFRILKQEGIPSQSIIRKGLTGIRKIAEIATTPISEIGKETWMGQTLPLKQLPQQTGTMPEYAPGVAPGSLSIQEQPARKIVQEAITPRREEIAKTLGITPQEFAIKLSQQKRGTISLKMIEETAKKIPATMEEILTIPKGTTAKAEKIEAYSQTIEGYKKNVIEKAKRVYELDPTNENYKTLNDATAKVIKSRLKIEAMRSESARALSSSRILSQAKDQVDTTAANINRLTKSWSPEDRAQLQEQLVNVDVNNPREVFKKLINMQKAPFMKKVLEYYKASLLSSPVTHIRNSVSNVLYQMKEVPARGISGVVSATKSKITGKPQEIFTGEAIKLMYGGLKAVPEATTQAMKALRDEMYGLTKTKMLHEHGLPSVKGKKGEIIRIPYRALQALDLFARTIKNGAEMDAVAYRMAKQGGAKGKELVEKIEEIKRNPSPEMIQEIETETDRAIFIKKLGGIGTTIEKAKNQHPILQFISPFFRTPINLTKEAVRMTPFQLTKYASKKYREPKNEVERLKDVGNVILGSLLGGTIMWKQLDGSIEISGKAPDNPAERDKFYREGKQPYSVKINNKWYSFRGIEPFSTAFVLWAQLGELMRSKDPNENSVEENINNVVTTTAMYLEDQTFFTGMANFLEAISGGKYNQGVTLSGSNYLAQLLGGFVPNVFYSATRAINPKIYQTKGIKEEIQKRIPGMQGGLTPKRNVWGEESIKPGTALGRFFSPVTVSEEVKNAVDEEMERIGLTMGFPSKTAFDLKVGGEEYDKMLEASGKTTYQILSEVIQTDEYQTLNDAEKEKLVKKIISEVRKKTKELMFPKQAVQNMLKKAIIEQGYTTEEAEKASKGIIQDMSEEEIMTIFESESR